MSDKFPRTTPHVNVGTIGHIDHGKSTLVAAIEHGTVRQVVQIMEKEEILHDLEAARYSISRAFEVRDEEVPPVAMKIEDTKYHPDTVADALDAFIASHPDMTYERVGDQFIVTLTPGPGLEHIDLSDMNQERERGITIIDKAKDEVESMYAAFQKESKTTRVALTGGCPIGRALRASSMDDCMHDDIMWELKANDAIVEHGNPFQHKQSRKQMNRQQEMMRRNHINKSRHMAAKSRRNKR